MKLIAVGLREGTACTQLLHIHDFSFHLNEGESRMRLRGREGMVVDEGEGFSEKSVKR